MTILFSTISLTKRETYAELRSQVIGVRLVDLLPTCQSVRELVVVRLVDFLLQDVC
jgi:hypothetical protein